MSKLGTHYQLGEKQPPMYKVDSDSRTYNRKYMDKPLNSYPFESKKNYRHLNFEIDDSKSSDEFLSKVDLVINDYSTLSLESIINKVPVLNVRRLINGELIQLRDYFPAKIGYPIKSMKHLKEILSTKYINMSKVLSEKKHLKKISSEVPLHLDTIEIMVNFFKNNYQKQNNYFSFFSFFNLLIREIKTFLKVRSETVYRFYNPNDTKLLKKFSK